MAVELDTALRLARSVVPEWGVLPFKKRKEERERYLYSQAIVQRAMLRIFGNWYTCNDRDGRQGDWERWRPNLLRLKRSFDFRGIWLGEFLARENPLFFSSDAGGSIYQLNKRAIVRKQQLEKAGLPFEPDPLTDLSVQNTRLSQELVHGQVKAFLEEGGAAAPTTPVALSVGRGRSRKSPERSA